jgi:hypothetical protein
MRRRMINAARTAALKAPEEVRHEEVQEKPTDGYNKKMCPHCKVVPFRFFHVRACKKK